VLGHQDRVEALGHEAGELLLIPLSYDLRFPLSLCAGGAAVLSVRLQVGEELDGWPSPVPMVSTRASPGSPPTISTPTSGTHRRIAALAP
jgi:hypothetical protein